MIRSKYTNKQHQVQQSQSKSILFVIISLTLKLLTKKHFKNGGRNKYFETEIT